MAARAASMLRALLEEAVAPLDEAVAWVEDLAALGVAVAWVEAVAWLLAVAALDAAAEWVTAVAGRLATIPATAAAT